jgi:hypothetical protein
MLYSMNVQSFNEVSNKLKKTVLDVAQVEEEVDRIVRGNLRTCSSYNQDEVCPAAILREVSDMDDGALVGYINKVDATISQSSDYSTPLKSCFHAKSLMNIKLLYQVPIYSHKNDACIKTIKEMSKGNKGVEDQRLDYYQSLIFEKRKFINDNLNSLISAKLNIEKLLDPELTKLNCSEFSFDFYTRKCEQLKKCPASLDHFEKNISNIMQALKLIQGLKNEWRKNPSSKDIKGAINSIYDLYPFLREDGFQSQLFYTTKPIDENIIRSQYKLVLSRTKESIQINLKKNIDAFQCLDGNSNDCSDFSKTIRTNLSGKIYQEPASLLYNCVENAKANRNEANKVLNEVAVSAILSFTPGVIASIGKSVLTVSKLADNAITLSRAKNVTSAIPEILNVGNAANEIIKIKEACSDKLKMIKKTQDDLISCQSSEVNYNAEQDYGECQSQLILASISTIIPSISLTMYRPLINQSPNLMSKLGVSEDRDFLKKLDLFLSKSKSEVDRISRLKSLEGKVNSLLSSKEKYTSEEVKNAIKVIFNQCLEK